MARGDKKQARGEKERQCLKRIKEFVFPNADVPIANEANMSLLHTSVFGFTLEDWREFCGILAEAKPNDNLNEFPDFASGDFVLEHFEISATKEGKKGSTFKRKHEPFLKSVRKNVDDALASDESIAINHPFSYPGRNHALLLDSLERNLNNHVESLAAYAANHKVAKTVFIIELQEHNLMMFENVYSDTGEGRVFGDLLRKPQKFANYRLSRDKKALELLHAFVDKLDIVVFAGVECVEIFKLDEIPNMLKLMPWPFVVAAGPTIESYTLLPVLHVMDTVKEQEHYEHD